MQRGIEPAIDQLAALVPGPPLPIDELRLTGSATLASAFDANTVAFASAAACNLSAGITDVDHDRVVASMTGHVEIGTAVPE